MISTRKNLFTAAVALVLGALWSGTPAYADQADTGCIARKCASQALGCMLNGGCKSWMDCIRACGDDEMACPTFCAFYYPSPKANEFMACALKNQCIRMDFSGYPACVPPTALVTDLTGLDGTWWFTLYHGSDKTFDAQQNCRKVVFASQTGQVLIGDYTVPLTAKSKTKICGEKGSYTLQSSGAVAVDHDSMPGYYLENWYVAHKSKNTLLVRVCIDETAASRDLRTYATLVLTRAPLPMLDPAEVQALDQASQQQLGLALSAYQTADNSACVNK